MSVIFSILILRVIDMTMHHNISIRIIDIATIIIKIAYCLLLFDALLYTVRYGRVYSMYSMYRSYGMYSIHIMYNMRSMYNKFRVCTVCTEYVQYVQDVQYVEYVRYVCL